MQIRARRVNERSRNPTFCPRQGDADTNDFWKNCSRNQRKEGFIDDWTTAITINWEIPWSKQHALDNNRFLSPRRPSNPLASVRKGDHHALHDNRFLSPRCPSNPLLPSALMESYHQPAHCGMPEDTRLHGQVAQRKHCKGSRCAFGRARFTGCHACLSVEAHILLEHEHIADGRLGRIAPRPSLERTWTEICRIQNRDCTRVQQLSQSSGDWVH